MDKQDIIIKVKALNFADGSYIVFGSCPMAVAGLRKAGDIDFLVDKTLFNKLSSAGWKVLDKGPNDKPLVLGDFEAHDNWNFTSYRPTLKHLLNTADIVDGVPFASLSEVLKWKTASGRPKDLVDIKLIEEYLNKS